MSVVAISLLPLPRQLRVTRQNHPGSVAADSSVISRIPLPDNAGSTCGTLVTRRDMLITETAIRSPAAKHPAVETGPAARSGEGDRAVKTTMGKLHVMTLP